MRKHSFPTRRSSDLEFALFGEVRQLSPEDQQDVLNFIRYKRSLQEKRKGHDPAD